MVVNAFFCGKQERRMMHNLRNYEVPLHRYIAMMDLQVRYFFHLFIVNFPI